MSVLGSVELLSPIVFMNLFQAPSSSAVWAKAPDVSTLAITPSKVAATTQRKTVAHEPNAKAPLRLGFRSCGIPLPEVRNGTRPGDSFIQDQGAFAASVNRTGGPRPRQRSPHPQG